MFAIIECGGKQYNVSAGDTIRVEKLDNEVGAKLTFDAIFASEEGQIKVGEEAKAVKVTAEVVAHGKASLSEGGFAKNFTFVQNSEIQI